MSSRATYNVPYDMNERDRRKKAFIRMRKRKRLIAMLSFLVVAVGLFVAIIVLIIGTIKRKHQESLEREKYVDFQGEYEEILLIDNSTAGRGDGSVFFEIVEGEKKPVDLKAEKYKDIIPGSKGLVIVDAGHGGYDGGADGYGLLEKDVNLAISYKLKDELVLRGYIVKLTRPDDEFVGLTQRASIANSLDNPLCLISIHQNSLDASEGSASGMESWTYDREGCKELGEAIVDAASAKTGARNRGTNFRKNLVVTSKTTMPAIIFECGYLTDEEEAAKLGTDSYQDLIVEGIVDGVDAFRNNYYGDE